LGLRSSNAASWLIATGLPSLYLTRLPAQNSVGDAIMRPNQSEAQAMGHPTLSFEEVRQRNEEIVAYANQHPEVTSTSLAVKYGLSRETIRQILDRARRQTERNQRLAAKAQHWGFRGH
jgi:predicted HTH transcriptional regulator